MTNEQGVGEEKQTKCCSFMKCKSGCGKATGGCMYGVAVVGAAAYFIQHADTFWMGVLGVLKAIVWPALVMYKVLEMLQF